MGIKSDFIVETAPSIVVTTQWGALNDGLVLADATTGVAVEYITLSNPTAAAVNGVTLASPLALYETARSVAELTNVASVTGGSYPDTGATAQTLSFPARSSVTLTVTHTFDMTPNDVAGNVLQVATSTPLYTVTDGVGTNANVVPGATFVVGRDTRLSTSILFNPRSKNSPMIWSALTNMKPSDLAELLDWLEAGNNLHDLIYAAQQFQVAKTTYTQTYSTASATMPAATSLAIPAGGTGAAAGGWDTAGNRDLAITAMNAIRTDLDNVKKVVNQLIDDQQARGLAL